MPGNKGHMARMKRCGNEYVNLVVCVFTGNKIREAGVAAD